MGLAPDGPRRDALGVTRRTACRGAEGRDGAAGEARWHVWRTARGRQGRRGANRRCARPLRRQDGSASRNGCVRLLASPSQGGREGEDRTGARWEAVGGGHSDARIGGGPWVRIP